MFMGIVKKHTALLFDKNDAVSSSTDINAKLEVFAAGFRADMLKLKAHYLMADCDAKCPCLYSLNAERSLFPLHVLLMSY